MDWLSPALKNLRDFSGPLDSAVVTWASDGKVGAPAGRVSYGWPMASLEEALLACGAYIAVVVVMTIIFGGLYGFREAPSPGKLSVAEKFRREPILFIQALYNPAQVALCAYMMVEAVREIQNRNFTLICNEFLLTDKAAGMARVVWIFYLSKIFDFCDTVFMIARCKWRQLSFLHLYHHISIFLVYWVNLQPGYDGDIYFTVVLNSFIHFVMYFYYTARTFNISVPSPIKALVTKAQMIQFVCMNLQAGYLLYTGCGAFPRNNTWFYLFYIISMLVLFNNFSQKTYRAKPGKGKKAE
jgi:elongation of very long chain fatty acids protein 4